MKPKQSALSGQLVEILESKEFRLSKPEELNNILSLDEKFIIQKAVLSNYIKIVF